MQAAEKRDEKGQRMVGRALAESSTGSCWWARHSGGEENKTVSLFNQQFEARPIEYNLNGQY